MKTIKLILVTFILVLGFGNSAIASEAIPNNTLAPMLQQVLPAVVNIKAQIKAPMPDQFSPPRRNKNNDDDDTAPDQMVSLASGVIVDAKNGFIITNAHAVNNAQTITVTLGDSRHYNAKMIGIDKPSDIALLQIRAQHLTAIPISNSNELKVGDFVAAIGNPFGLNQTVTSGIVSALGRTGLGIENYENFIQTDTPINPGNSGGALINLQGQLVGINTAVLSPTRGTGIGFAIPSNMARSVMDQLLKYGNVQRGSLGIVAQDVTPELALAFNLGGQKGAVISQVMPNSPAQQGGLAPGDVITSLNNVAITNASDVVNTIGFLRVDSKVTINVLRNAKPVSVTAVLSDPKKREKAEQIRNPFLYGISLKEFDELSPIHGNVNGILVLDVMEDTTAWHSDLRPGDIIVSANQQKVSHIVDLQKIANASKDTFLLNVLRGSGAVFLVFNKET